MDITMTNVYNMLTAPFADIYGLDTRGLVHLPTENS